MALQAGKLNRRIIIQKRDSSETDAASQPIDVWVNLHELWAWHKNISGRAGLQDNVMIAVNADSFRIHYTKKQIDVGMRILCSGQYFDITRVVTDIAKREYIDLICEVDASHA